MKKENEERVQHIDNVHVVNNIEDALREAALGGTYETHKVVEKEFGGKISTEESVEKKEVPPNAQLLQKMMDERIGGPQDWC